MAFDDSNLKDYVDVATRLAEFRGAHPEGSIQPLNLAEPWRMVQVQGFEKNGEVAQQTFIVYTAAAYRDPGDTKPGVGCAWEIWPGRTPYTRGSELMNAETSAWGRAIVAALAADTRKGIATRQDVELAEAARGEDGWPEGTKPAAAPPANGQPLPEPKRRAIFAQFNELRIKDAEEQRSILAEILKRPVGSRKGLTADDADKVITALRKRPRPAPEVPAS